MAFDVDVFREAHRPWSFSIGGRAFSARHVSALQVLRYEEQTRDAIQTMAKDAPRGARLHVMAVRHLLRLAFPWRPSYLVRGDPVKIIIALEPAARSEALKDFFACLQGTTATPLKKGKPPIPGTSSRGRTPLPSP